jgi:hypothetical protein
MPDINGSIARPSWPGAGAEFASVVCVVAAADHEVETHAQRPRAEQTRVTNSRASVP